MARFKGHVGSRMLVRLLLSNLHNCGNDILQLHPFLYGSLSFPSVCSKAKKTWPNLGPQKPKLEAVFSMETKRPESFFGFRKCLEVSSCTLRSK